MKILDKILYVFDVVFMKIEDSIDFVSSAFRYNLYVTRFWWLRKYGKDEFHSWLNLNPFFSRSLVPYYKKKYNANLIWTRQVLHQKGIGDPYEHLTLEQFLDPII